MQLHKQFTIILCLAFVFFSCKEEAKDNKIVNEQKQVTADSAYSGESDELIPDSIYLDKHYKFVLKKFSEQMEINDSTYEFIPNTVLSFQKLVNGKYVELFTDSIACEQLLFDYKQFMGDSLPELMINNNRDFRSNWTYYLYAVDTLNDKIKRIKNFEIIKNPNYLPQYDLVDNYVASDQFWTNFYKINADTVIDFDMVVNGGGPVAEGEKDTFEEDYNRALKKVLKRVKAIHLNVKQ